MEGRKYKEIQRERNGDGDRKRRNRNRRYVRELEKKVEKCVIRKRIRLKRKKIEERK